MNCIPMCDDGTMADNDVFKLMFEHVIRAFSSLGIDVIISTKIGRMLRAAGFINIHCRIKKVPIGVWARDKSLRLIGLYQKLVVQDVIPSFSGRRFQSLGLTPDEAEKVLKDGREALNDTSVHRYFNYYFWYAQKPPT